MAAGRGEARTVVERHAVGREAPLVHIMVHLQLHLPADVHGVHAQPRARHAWEGDVKLWGGQGGEGRGRVGLVVLVLRPPAARATVPRALWQAPAPSGRAAPRQQQQEACTGSQESGHFRQPFGCATSPRCAAPLPAAHVDV